MLFELLENENLARYTSWKIGGPARFFLNAGSSAELLEALAWAQEQGLRVWLLGGGTNTLALDRGFDGAVLRYRAHSLTIEEQSENSVLRIGACAPMAGTARRIARQGWAGLEWAEGLPGTIGGALYGNAGCYGSDIASTLRRAWLLIDGQVVEWSVEDFGYGYRTSVLKTISDPRSMKPAPWFGPIILEAEFALQRADPQELAVIMERTATQRRSKTPAGQSCGSVFKNPAGESAGRLIEASGLKGRRVGGAEIAQKHANYIVNTGGATSDDVLELINIAHETVLHQFGVELELEVQMLR